MSAAGHEYGRMLREERERQRITIPTLAARAELPAELVERIEHGEHDPYLSELVALARALSVQLGPMVNASVGA
jgi:ribosome-binding protein aMBF1 (putative translation factor)